MNEDGSKDHVGSFELRSRTRDTVEGPISEAYIQHWFQEEFLRLIYEEPEFREQVLKCLLTGDDDEGNVDMRKPRRTWFNGVGEIQEVSCEEARYLHLCGETNSTDSDLCSEAANEKCQVKLRTNFVTYEQLKQQHVVEKQTAVSLVHVADDLFSSKNQSGILIGCNSKVNKHLPEMVTSGPESPDERLESPLLSVVASEVQHKNLENLTGPCFHERGTQTWKANPLYLHSTSDSESNDSWQHESSSIAWMDDLENGKMLQEVKMRKVKRLEESRPSRKAEGCKNCREHSKSDHEMYLSSNIHRLCHYFPEDRKAGHSRGKKNLDEEGKGDLSIDSLCRASPSFICVLSEPTKERTVTSSTEKKSTKENLPQDDEKSTNLPFVDECRGLASSYICVPGDDVREFSSASASAEGNRSDQDMVLNSPLIIVSQDLPFIFFQDDDEALLKHTLSEISLPKHKLNGEVRLSSGQISGTQEFVINENEKHRTFLESTSPAEERLRLKEEFISPVSNMSNSTLLDKLHRNEEELQPLASSYATPLTSVQFVSLTKGISFSPHCALDVQGERISPSGSICGLTKTLKEHNVSQGQPCSLLSSEYEEVLAGEETLHERNKRVHEETGPSCLPNKMRFDEGDWPALVGPHQVSICGSVSGQQMTDSLVNCGGRLNEKKVSNPISPRILRACHLAAIDEEEQVVDLTKPLNESASRPTATRTAFKPTMDIYWLPPKRNIQFTGIRTRSTHSPSESLKRNSTK